MPPASTGPEFDRPHPARAGTTLLELMVVLVVVAILATIAVPGYRHHVLRTYRVEAKNALLALAAAQERFHLVHRTYAAHSQLVAPPPDGLGLQPATAGGRYTIAIDAGADAATFLATATATGAQLADTACASFTIDAAGRRSARRRDGGAAPACWD